MEQNFDAAGGHPLKKLRRQTIEEFEEEFMSAGKPSATVINMRNKDAHVEPVKDKDVGERVFMGIKERESASTIVESC